MRWAVTGAHGMLGRDLVALLAAREVDVRALSRRDLDVRDPSACRAGLRDVDVVVNCAAWTEVDGAEAAEGAAFAVNAVGAANVARAAESAGAAVVQVSTDYVFDGRGSSPYRVSSPVAPVNAYGRTKAAGEWAVRAESSRAYVVRTAWLYGAGGPSFPATMLRLAQEREVLQVVDDQRGQPTWTVDLAEFLVDLVSSGAPPGTYHGSATGETTKFGLAREVFALAGLDPARVRPTTSDAFPTPAVRPAYSVLENHDALPTWRDALARALPTLSAR